MSLGQYLKDTQSELRHVAWPTRTQTIVFTILVAFISVFVALYLGLFDYVFTTSLTNYLGSLPAATVETATSSESGITVTPLDPGSTVDFEVSTTTQ